MHELHDGRESSRVKDLIDLVVISKTQNVRADTVNTQINLELRLRKLKTISEFAVPKGWLSSRQEQYVRLAKETGLYSSMPAIEDAGKAVSTFLDPILSGSVSGMIWNPNLSSWESG